jgi:hypothetical protein
MKVVFVLILLLSVTAFSYAQNDSEEIVVTTYYPAPYGDYTDLTAENLTVSKDAFLATDSGNVTIGTGTVSGTAKLQILGNVAFQNPAGLTTPQYTISNVKQPVDDNDVATKAYVSAAAGSQCYTSYSGSCDTVNGFNNIKTIGDWEACGNGSTQGYLILPPGSGFTCAGLAATHGSRHWFKIAYTTDARGNPTSYVEGTAVLCCK